MEYMKHFLSKRPIHTIQYAISPTDGDTNVSKVKSFSINVTNAVGFRNRVSVSSTTFIIKLLDSCENINVIPVYIVTLIDRQINKY